MKRLAPLACLLASTFLALGVAEIAARHYFRSVLHFRLSERNTFYQYDSELGWFPVPNRRGDFTGSRKFSIVQNSSGFRDREHPPVQRPRMMFLGDSFVYGYNVEAAERFTDRLQARLPQWDIYNLGVSGYGNDQEFLLLQRVWPTLHPDVVFLIFCTENDREDNSFNRRYGGYFKPYFNLLGTHLKLAGVPVPKSINFYFSRYPLLFRSTFLAEIAQAVLNWRQPPIHKGPDPTGEILEEMKKFVEGHHAKFVIGTTAPTPFIKEICIRNRIACIDLVAAPREKDEVGHWTAQGHKVVADYLYRYIKKNETYWKN